MHRLVRPGRAAILAIALGLAITPLAIAVPPAAAAKTAPARIKQFCPLHVIVYRAKGAANVYVFALRADGEGGQTSGILSVYSGNDRYDVPYANRQALGTTDVLVAQENRFAVKFPPNVAIDAAYVARMMIPEPFDCPLGFVWPRDAEGSAGVQEIASDVLREPAVPAPAPVTEPSPTCAEPERRLQTHEIKSPEIRDFVHENGITGEVQFKVMVLPDGSAGGAEVTKSSGSAVVDQAVKLAALQSTFDPELWHCRPIISRFLYTIQYGAR
jgi:TonB family protein